MSAKHLTGAERGWEKEVSKLMNGKYHLASEGRLLGFLNRLGRKVIMHIAPRRKGEQALELV